MSALRASSPASARGELKRLRRALRVGVLDDAGELVPVHAAVEAETEPAAMPDVRRDEETLRVHIDKRGLHSGSGGAPDREPAVAVEVGEDHHERLLLADEERRRAVTQPLARLGELERDGAQP